MFRRCLAALSPSALLGLIGLCTAPQIWAQNQAQQGGSVLNSDYAFEVAPFIGKTLPYDLWGTPGNLKALGVRGAFRAPNANGAIEASYIYHYEGPDKASTIDLSYRYEVYSTFIDGYFNVGVHFSHFKLKADLDEAGNCVLVGCVTDSGKHSGLTYGAGIMIPAGQSPIRLGVRFYQNPQSWLLLEAGYGFRF